MSYKLFMYKFWILEVVWINFKYILKKLGPNKWESTQFSHHKSTDSDRRECNFAVKNLTRKIFHDNQRQRINLSIWEICHQKSGGSVTLTEHENAKRCCRNVLSEMVVGPRLHNLLKKGTFWKWGATKSIPYNTHFTL